MRVQWEENEAVLLIDLYNRITEKKVSRDEGVVFLSNLLRRHGERTGLQIDEIYRNVNGINMRLEEISYIFNNEGGLKNTSRLFMSLVDLYKNKRKKFEKLLFEAKTSMFFDFFPKMLSPTENYLYRHCFGKIEKYCVENKIITKSLFEIRDKETLGKVRQKILNDSKFCKRNKSNMGIIRNLLDYFEVYCNGLGHFSRNVVVDATEANDEELDKKAEVSGKETIDNTTQKTAITSGDTIYLYFIKLWDNYPELVFTNHDATNVVQRRCVYIYPKNMPRRGNVAFELWQTGNKNAFVLFAKRQYLSEQENRKADYNLGKGSTSTKGKLDLVFHYREEIIDFFKEKLDLLQKDIKSKGSISSKNSAKDSVKQSLKQTVAYLKSRYSVRLHYDHFANPNRYTDDLLYKVNNGKKDIIWVYMKQNNTANYISIETEPT